MNFDIVELVYEYPLNLPIPEKEDYFQFPISTAKEMGLNGAIFTTRTKLNPKKKDVINGTQIFRFDNLFSMFKKIIQIKPNIIWGHSFGWLPATLAPLLQKTYVLTPHVYKLDVYPKWKVDSVFAFIKKSKAIVVVTNFEALQFSNAIEREKIHIIPHSIDYEFFSSRDCFESEKKLESLGSPDKIILCVANIFPRKNLETLIRSFATIKKEINKVKLIIVGGEPKTKLGFISSSETSWNYHLKLKQLIKFHGLTEDIIFTGHKSQTELRDYYRIADVFCLSSLKESQLLAAGEAAASGIPLVLSNLEPLKEIYSNCALFQHPLDHKKLSSNIISIFNDQKLAKKLSNNGQEKMLDYRPEKIRAKMKNLYSSLL